MKSLSLSISLFLLCVAFSGGVTAKTLKFATVAPA